MSPCCIVLLICATLVCALYDPFSLFFFPGLVEIAKGLGLQLLAPRKKITILLIGNHSAGKSSFINWSVVYFDFKLFYFGIKRFANSHLVCMIMNGQLSVISSFSYACFLKAW